MKAQHEKNMFPRENKNSQPSLQNIEKKTTPQEIFAQ